MDFERAILRAFASVFPGVKLSGCFFHFKQSLRRQLGQRGLLALFNKNAEFQQLIQMILSLAFVPEQSVAAVFESVVKDYLRENMEDWSSKEESIVSFMAYVEATYIGKTITRVGAGEDSSFRRAPLFPFSTWVKHNDVLEGLCITNNHAEGFNSSWNKSLEKNPNIFQVIEGFKREESLSLKKLSEFAKGVDGSGRAGQKDKKMQRHKQLCTLLRNFGMLSNKSFLLQVSRFSV